MNKIQRTFILGDCWNYFKLYTGFKTADTILVECIYPLSQMLLKNKLIDKWFFIRYNDPEFHLRIRFHTEDASKSGDIIYEFTKRIKGYVANDLIWKMQADTYNRELERYGDNNIEYSETLFWYDSEMICKIIALNEVRQNENLRWLLGLRMINVLLTDFGYTLEEKCELLQLLQENYEKEFGITKNYKKQFALKYRKEKQNIESIINSNNENFKLLFSQIMTKSEYTKMVVSQIKKNIDETTEKNYVLSSYIHMMMNRLFRTQQRKYELVLYDFLYMYYNSQKARQSKENKE
jgi:thiopeptide-type bacteriocin biosynthesis protein